MKKEYFVNNNIQDAEDGRHNEVHTEGCYWMPKNVTYLGEYYDCKGAMSAAKAHYPYTADGCKHCCEECHKG